MCGGFRSAKSRPDPFCDVRTLWSDLVADLSARPGRATLAGVGIVAWLGFHWGLGNDVALAVISARTYNAVDTVSGVVPGIAAVLAATVVGAAFWAATQILDVMIVLTGLQLVPRVSNRLRATVVQRFSVVPAARMRPTTRLMVAYTMGASALCLLDGLATGDFGIGSRRRLIGHSVALSAGSVGLVLGLITTLTMIGRRVPAWRPAAESFARWAAVPWTWIVLFVAAALIRGAFDRFRAAPVESESAPRGEPSTNRADR